MIEIGTKLGRKGDIEYRTNSFVYKRRWRIHSVSNLMTFHLFILVLIYNIFIYHIVQIKS